MTASNEDRQNFWQRGTSRRRALQGAAIGGAGIAAAALAACAPSSNQSQTATEVVSQPKRGGTVTDGRFRNIANRTLDPHTNTPATNRQYRLWYQGLLGYGMYSLEVEPEVAEKWEQPSETEYIFRLQPNVKWHNRAPVNGRALTAEDVVKSFDRARTNDPRFAYASLLDGINQMQAVDKGTIRVTTKSPDVVFLLKLSSDGPLLMAPETIEKADKYATVEEVVGTGPFILQSLDQDIGNVSVRNPDHWKPGLPYIDEFRYRMFADDQTAYSAFLAGGLELTVITGPALKDHLSRGGPNFKPEYAKATLITSYFTPNTKTKPWDDPRVTRAMRLLVDYKDLLEGWGATWYPRITYGTALPSLLEAWDYTHEEYANMVFWKMPKDAAVKEAMDLLNAAGFNRSNPLNFEASAQVNVRGNEQETMVVLIQDQWKRASQGVVNAELKILDGGQATAARAGRTFSYGFFANSGAIDDPDAWLSQIWASNASRNYSGWSDTEVDALINRQRVTFDLQQRKSIVKDIVRLITERSPYVLAGRPYYLNGVKPTVRNYTPESGIPYPRQHEQIWLDT